MPFLQVATNKVNSPAKIASQVGLQIRMSNPWSSDQKHLHSRKHFKKVTHQPYHTEKPAERHKYKESEDQSKQSRGAGINTGQIETEYN